MHLFYPIMTSRSFSVILWIFLVESYSTWAQGYEAALLKALGLQVLGSLKETFIPVNPRSTFAVVISKMLHLPNRDQHYNVRSRVFRT